MNFLQRGWYFISHSFNFMLKNKDLFALPFICAACVTIFWLLCFGGVAFTFIKEGDAASISVIASILVFVVAFFVTAFLAIYFNTVLTACIINRLKGESYPLSAGFSLANNRLGKIVQWTLLSTTVGLIIHALENSHDLIAEIIGLLIGLTWGLCALFVIPAMVVENVGPIGSLKHSAKAFGRNWRLNLGVGLYFALFTLVIIALFVLAGYAVAFTGPYFILSIAVCAVLYLIGIFIMGQLRQVVHCALYLHYVGQTETTAFSAESLESAKRQRHLGRFARMFNRK